MTHFIGAHRQAGCLSVAEHMDVREQLPAGSANELQLTFVSSSRLPWPAAFNFQVQSEYQHSSYKHDNRQAGYLLQRICNKYCTNNIARHQKLEAQHHRLRQATSVVQIALFSSYTGKVSQQPYRSQCKTNHNDDYPTISIAKPVLLISWEKLPAPTSFIIESSFQCSQLSIFDRCCNTGKHQAQPAPNTSSRIGKRAIVALPTRSIARTNAAVRKSISRPAATAVTAW